MKAMNEYSRMVKAAQVKLASQSQANWDLGDIALNIEPIYGEETLQRLVDDIGIEYKTLLDYRWVAQAYEESERSGNSWTVHQVFAGQPDRVALVRQKSWTVREARREVSRRMAQQPTPARS
jgi:hypothetical protein